MAVFLPRIAVLLLVAVPLAGAARSSPAQNLPCLFLPDPRTIVVREPPELPQVQLPDLPPPPTVSDPQEDGLQRYLSLDEALCIALANTQVVRVLAGVAAASSGSTIYDTAIVSNEIVRQQARFDPVFEANNTWSRSDSPAGIFDPPGPAPPEVFGFSQDNHRFDLGLSQTNVTGGTARLGLNTVTQRPGSVLDPETRSSLDLSYIQPLLQGGGVAANLVPVVLARIDTERSFFQFKDSVQELVRGVIEAYWSLVAARTDWWARQRQLEQAQFALDLTQARFEARIVDIGPLAQARVSLGNFRSSEINARNNVLAREAALRNILGLPPTEGGRLVPVTAPPAEQIDFQWHSVLQLAAERRPDLVELKLILEADQQLLLQARNQALPRLDALGLYRWNGLEGELPGGQQIASDPGQFGDWSLGVNFSVPLGLRRERAALRSRELLITRDQANLEQGLHSVSHILAQNLRSLAEVFEQYRIARETRDAARVNLNVQLQNYVAGRTQYINVLLAINDWGNTISSEAQFLSRYSVELANLERQTGTILETHGIRFYEERFCHLGPLGRLGHGQSYPAALPPSENAPRYPTGTVPAEESFQLDNPVERRSPPDSPAPGS